MDHADESEGTEGRQRSQKEEGKADGPAFTRVGQQHEFPFLPCIKDEKMLCVQSYLYPPAFPPDLGAAFIGRTTQ